jgi:hypothetical protein
MVDEFIAVIASLLAGLAGGFLSSFMAWNASGEEFNGRKHGNALIIGTITGLAAGVTSAVVVNEDLTTGQFALQLVGIFLAAVGIDRIRSDTSKSAAMRAVTETKPPNGTVTPPK